MSIDLYEVSNGLIQYSIGLILNEEESVSIIDTKYLKF